MRGENPHHFYIKENSNIVNYCHREKLFKFFFETLREEKERIALV